MSYDEHNDMDDEFGIGGVDGDEPLDLPDQMGDFGLDEEDPDKDS